MRSIRSLVALLMLGLLTLAACSATPSAPGAPGASSTPAANQGGNVAAASAKSAIEAASKVTLVEEPDSDADSTVFLNTNTIATDGQLVAVFLAKDATSVKTVADAMRAGFAVLGQIKTYTNKNVIVMYAAIGGADNSAAVEAAVKGL